MSPGNNVNGVEVEVDTAGEQQLKEVLAKTIEVHRIFVFYKMRIHSK